MSQIANIFLSFRTIFAQFLRIKNLKNHTKKIFFSTTLMFTSYMCQYVCVLDCCIGLLICANKSHWSNHFLCEEFLMKWRRWQQQQQRQPQQQQQERETHTRNKRYKTKAIIISVDNEQRKLQEHQKKQQQLHILAAAAMAVSSNSTALSKLLMGCK